MTLETLLNSKSFDMDDLEMYIKECGGIDKLRKKDLNKIVESQTRLMFYEPFMDIYKIVSTNESSKAMKVWTWIAGFASVVSVIVSIISLAISLSGKS